MSSQRVLNDRLQPCTQLKRFLTYVLVICLFEFVFEKNFNVSRVQLPNEPSALQTSHKSAKHGAEKKKDSLSPQTEVALALAWHWLAWCAQKRKRIIPFRTEPRPD